MVKYSPGSASPAYSLFFENLINSYCSTSKSMTAVMLLTPGLVNTSTLTLISSPIASVPLLSVVIASFTSVPVSAITVTG